MQRFVSPIGFSSHLVTRPIIAKGISAGDKVVIVRPDQPDQGSADRADNAIDDVRSTLSGVVSSVDVEVVVIEDLAFDAVVDRCSELILDGPPPVVCLGAGAMDLHLPMTIATTAHSEHVVSVVMHSDLNNTTEEVALPPLTNSFPGRARETFATLMELYASDPVRIAAIAEANDVARTTVSRHVDALEDRQFVTSEIRSKNKVVWPTTLGRLVARNHS